MNVTITEDRLLSRGPAALEMMARLSTRSAGWKTTTTTNERIIALHGGNPVGAYRDWRFSTVVSWLNGNYFEQWFLTDPPRSHRLWYLRRAYLHLYTLNRSEQTEREFLALHCDPNEAETESHWRYKRGPHLHVKCAPFPFPKAHLALNLGELDQVLSSPDSISAAMAAGITLIRERVIDLYETEGVRPQ